LRTALSVVLSSDHVPPDVSGCIDELGETTIVHDVEGGDHHVAAAAAPFQMQR